MAVLLTQEEADELLEMLKKCASAALNFPAFGRRADFDVTGINDKSKKFVISVNRKNRYVNKVSFVARYKSGDVRLLRLDVNPSERHTNPEGTDGNTIEGTHLHIYKEGFHDRYAIPFDLKDKGLDDTFKSFLERFNVVDIPQIRMQISDKEV